MEIGLSLGSNLGDRFQNLRQAKNRIIALKGVSFVVQSPVYETEPVGVPPDDCKLYFLNVVIIIETALPIPELIARFQSVEHEMGRSPTRPSNASRLIDIDIIYADGLRFSAEGVTVPHPRWFERRFVVQPLSDVRPDLIIPGRTGPVAEVFRKLSDKHQAKLFTKEW